MHVSIFRNKGGLFRPVQQRAIKKELTFIKKNASSFCYMDNKINVIEAIDFYFVRLWECMRAAVPQDLNANQPSATP